MSAVPDHIRVLLDERRRARAEKDFARADELRAQIDAAGFIVRDTPEGPIAEPKPRYETVDPAAVDNVLGRPSSLDLSIHLLAEGYPEDLRRFLDAFEATNDTARVEVVVVDNGGSDGEAVEDALEDRSWARALHLDRELGWAAARNAGLKTSVGSIVVLADLSVEPAGDIVTPLRVVFDDADVAVAGPFGLVSEDLRSWRPAEGQDADAIEGYLLATRRELLVPGLMHERFVWYRNADIDLSFQLRASGAGRARVVPLPVRKHIHRGWEALDEDERGRRSKRNHAIFLERWRDRTDLLGPRDR